MNARCLSLALLLVGCGPDDDGGKDSGAEPAPQGTWAEAFDASTVTALSGVWGSGPDDVYMVGGDATTGEVWHYDGAEWSKDTTVPVTDLLVWVFGFGPDDVWAVGEGGAVIRKTAAGWEQLDAGTTEPLWGVWGASANDVWIVGGSPEGDAPTLLHWDGSAFTPHVLDAAQNDRNAVAVFKVWGIGGRTFAVGQDGLIIEFDGSQWVQMSAGADANDDFVSLWGTSSDHIVAVGGRASARIATFDGSTWTTSAPTGIPGLNAVSMGADDEAVIGGVYGWVGTFDPFTDELRDENVVDATSDVHAIWYDGAGTYYGVAGHFTEPYFGVPLVRTAAE